MSKKFYAYRGLQRNTYRSFPLVAIGASTGGVDAATTLFSHLSANSGLAFLYLQHIDQTKQKNPFVSFEAVTFMPVVQALDGMPVLPDHIYIISPGKETTIRNDHFVITRLPEQPLYRFPVDRLFATLAREYSGQLTGILLSGITRDGILGMQAIKAAGGTIFVEDDLAAFDFMTRSAIQAGVADHVLPPSQMASKLHQLHTHEPVIPSPVVIQKPQKKQAVRQNRKVDEQRTQRLQEKNNELAITKKALQRVTNDLQQFAYVSSHDLQEPLRKIIMFSDLLQQRFNKLLPQAGIEYVEKIVSAAQNMTHFLNDLLNFSRLNSEKEAFIPIDLNDLMERVLVSFHKQIQIKQAGISYWGLPTIEGISTQLELLFFHLLDNTLKFAHPQRPPEVTITAKPLTAVQVQRFNQLDRSLRYYDIVITDNGIGFKEEYARQIFVIFQRLNDKRDYPGSGIGLALCKKIAGIHQGEIYAVSKEQEGSVFHVILPAKQL